MLKLKAYYIVIHNMSKLDFSDFMQLELMD